MSLTASHVFRPGDAGYAEEIAGFQTGFAVRPEVVVGASDAEEVRAAVSHADRRGLPIGVQATGHGLPGAAEGGMLITTRRMDGVRIDAVARTAHIEAGVRWGQVVEAAAPHGLAPSNGTSPDVGIPAARSPRSGPTRCRTATRAAWCGRCTRSERTGRGRSRSSTRAWS